MKRIAILASGSGTNAENIIRYFEGHESIEVVKVLSNKPDAKVLERAKNLNISASSFNRAAIFESETLLNELQEIADFIILAGFLWKIPENLITAFPNRMINIHPALLPKYGGKGMYGMRVHEAVIANRENESGITIHFVNENYDEGAIIFQASVALEYPVTAEELASKIHELEYAHFPKIIEKIVLEA